MPVSQESVGLGTSILVVDDDATNLFVLSQLLEGASFAVLQAHNGYEAISLALKERPRVVLMDLSMPGMDGFEAATRILDEAGSSGFRPTIIAVSANVTAEHKQRCVDLGFAAFFSKPLNFETVIDDILAFIAPDQPP